MPVAKLRAWRLTDPAAWNAFDEYAILTLTQLWEWERGARVGGWRPVRLAIGPSHDEPVAGAQLLLRGRLVAGTSPTFPAARLGNWMIRTSGTVCFAPCER